MDITKIVDDVKKNMLLAEKELYLRYSECDGDGHYAPNNPEKERCGHCFRKLEYKSIRVEEIDSQKAYDSGIGIVNLLYLFQKV